MITLPGDVLEELAIYVQQYNKALLVEKDAALAKKVATGSILDLLKQHQCNGTEAGGCSLTVKPWTRQTLNMDLAMLHLTTEQIHRVVKVSTGISLDVRPLRG